MIPKELLYTKEHEWIRVEGDTGVIGITDHAQSALGDITYVELPKVGKLYAVNETIGTVESVKTVSEVFCPVSVEVLEVNATVNDQPELVNSDPYGQGWFVKVKIRKPEELSKLLNAAEYEAYSAESQRH